MVKTNHNAILLIFFYVFRDFLIHTCIKQSDIVDFDNLFIWSGELHQRNWWATNFHTRDCITKWSKFQIREICIANKVYIWEHTSNITCLSNISWLCHQNTRRHTASISVNQIISSYCLPSFRLHLGTVYIYRTTIGQVFLLLCKKLYYKFRAFSAYNTRRGTHEDAYDDSFG